MAQESGAIERWLTATLRASETITTYCAGGVWGHVAPQNRKPPYLIFAPIGGGAGGGDDETTLGGLRAVVERRYDVFVVAQDTGFSAMQEVADEIDALLHDAEQQATDPRFFCFRVGEVREAEPGVGGTIIYRSGGTYRFLVTPE